jgi:hypothetical protein
MKRSHAFLFGAALVAAMFAGGIAGAAALASSTNVNAAATAASPSPGQFKSNEDPAHEKGETAAQEAAENSGKFRPGGPGPGHSNETAAHEARESAAREAAENAAQASPSPAK